MTQHLANNIHSEALYLDRLVALLLFFVFSASPSLGDTMGYESFLRANSSRSAQDLVESGIENLSRNQLDSAMMYFSLVQSKTHDFRNEETKDIYLASLDGIGVVQYLTGNYAESYRMFSSALATDSTHIHSHLNIAGLHLLFDDDRKATEHLRKAYTKYLNSASYDEMAVSLTNLINIGLLYDNLDQSMDLIEQFLKLDFADSSPALNFAKHLALSATYYHDKDYLHASQSLKDALSHPDFKYLNGRMEVDIYGDIANTFDKMGLADSALHYLDIASDISDKLKNPDQTVWIENAYADILERSGRREEAFSHRYRSLSVADSIKTFSQFREIAGVESQLIVDEFKTVAERLRAEKRERNIVITFLWIIIAGFIAFFLVMRRKNKQLQMKNNVIFSAVSEIVEDNKEGLRPDPGVSEEMPEDGPRTDEHDEAPDATMDGEEEGYLLSLADRIDSLLRDSDGNDDDGRSLKCSLPELADMVNENPRNVSKAIKLRHGVNFNTYINGLRINQVIKMLKNDPKYREYTVDYIASIFGFKSRSNFTKVFSSVVGMTPSEWIRIENSNPAKQ